MTEKNKVTVLYWYYYLKKKYVSVRNTPLRGLALTVVLPRLSSESSGFENPRYRTSSVAGIRFREYGKDSTSLAPFYQHRYGTRGGTNLLETCVLSK